MKPEDRPLLESLSDPDLMALCIWSEARGESYDGMVAVGSVILNRVDYGQKHHGWGKLYGDSIQGVVLAKEQFSGFNSNNREYGAVINKAKEAKAGEDPGVTFGQCKTVSLSLINGTMGRTVHGIYYHTVDCNPPWAKDMRLEIVIGLHRFYYI